MTPDKGGQAPLRNPKGTKTMKAIRFSEFLNTETGKTIPSYVETLRDESGYNMGRKDLLPVTRSRYAVEYAGYNALLNAIGDMVANDFMVSADILDAKPYDIVSSLRNWPNWNDFPGILIANDFSGIFNGSLRLAFAPWTYDEKRGEFLTWD